MLHPSRQLAWSLGSARTLSQHVVGQPQTDHSTLDDPPVCVGESFPEEVLSFSALAFWFHPL